MKRISNFAFAAIFLFCSCSKESPVAPSDSNTPPVVITQSTTVTDPVDLAPSVVQSNDKAIQLNYGTVKIVSGMSVQLTNMTPGVLGGYLVHVYLRTASGAYLSLPKVSAAGVTYSFLLKVVYPTCKMNITTSKTASEVFNDVIVVAAKASYVYSLDAPLNFDDYASVKLHLGL